MSIDKKVVDLRHHGGTERVEDCFHKGLSMTFDHLIRKYNLSNQTLSVMSNLGLSWKLICVLWVTRPVMNDVLNYIFIMV